MKLTLNNKTVELDNSSRPVLSELLASQGVPSRGIAVAINNRVVRRDAWAETPLNDGDSITLITAICGG